MAWLQQLLMILGGIYLLYLGFLMLKSVLQKTGTASATQDCSTDPYPQMSHFKLLRQGFFTNMANPKALVYFSSVFALAIDTNTSLSAQGSLLALIFVESLIWFALVAFVFSIQRINTLYQKLSKWIDGITGGIFISFGCLLILNRD